MNSNSNLSMNDPNLVNALISHYDELDTCLHESDHLRLQSKLDLLLHFFTHNGQQLDRHPVLSHQLNIFFVAFRNLLRNNPTSVPYSIKLLILRLIEYRAAKWRSKESLEDFYRSKIPFIDTFLSPTPPSRQRNHQNFYPQNPFQNPCQNPYQNPQNPSRKRNTLRASKSAGDVSNLNNNNHQNSYLTNSYQYYNGSGSRSSMSSSRSMKKIQFEDDILIKNSESGRVMGVKGRRVHMIEQLSNTVISFQKVTSGSLNRLVHITGPSQEHIEIAKSIILTTIRENVSPITEDLSASRDSLGPGSDPSLWSLESSSHVTPAPEYRFSLWIRGEEMTVTLNIPQAGSLFEEFLAKNDFLSFAEKRFQESKESKNSQKIYDREFLLSLQPFAEPIFGLEIDPEFVKDNKEEKEEKVS